jgi:CDP-diacylglycerol--serine O-phosphatidyltransferase
MKNDPLPNKVLDVQEASRIYFLPNLFTAGNLFFGFLAIIRCIQAQYDLSTPSLAPGYYEQAVLFIFLSCVCDVLDGRVARMGGQASIFGIEFDSMADVVSFGVAPALMVFFIILSPTEGYPFFRQVGWLIGFIYLLCAAVRLARFNVITSPLLTPDEEGSVSQDFRGMPVPAAAGVIASLVLLLNNYDLQKASLGLPILMLLIAWLMVSSIPYPSFKKIDWHTKTRLSTFLLAIVIAIFIFLKPEFTLTTVFLGYTLFGLLRWIKNLIKGKKPIEAQS